jgi:PIN domain nuclease of toxin-antitoxin system
VIPDGFTERLRDSGFSLLDITAEHAEALRQFPELHRHDPFDVLLVAQASCAGLRPLAADRVLLGLGRDPIVDATS